MLTSTPLVFRRVMLPAGEANSCNCADARLWAAGTAAGTSATGTADVARTRRALTLVEMLIALACVVLLMLAYTQLFSNVSGRISDARSMIGLEERMRSATQQIRGDLASLTCNMLPWQNPSDGQGYFEYIEGPLSDQQPGYTDKIYPGVQQFLGDTDDVLMFTVHSKGAPFTGRYTPTPGGPTVSVQSQEAEVVWFLRPTKLPDGKTTVSPPTFTLYRRMFLVMPSYQGSATAISNSYAPPAGGELLPLSPFYAGNDISAHVEVSNGAAIVVANTLGDLTKRERRYGHAFVNNAAIANGFPHRVDPRYLVPFGGSLSNGVYTVDITNSHNGEDVVLTNVVAFDVQAWDPTAPVYNVLLNSATASAPATYASVVPGDPGFTAIPSLIPGTTNLYIYPNADSLGAYVDLGWAGASNIYSQFGPISKTTINGIGPNNRSVDVSLASIPVVALKDGTVSYTSPFYSAGHVKSQLVQPYQQVDPSLADYSQNWLFDDHLNSKNVPDYQYVNSSGQTRFYAPATFDTWSVHYEYDGLDQDGDGVPDQAADNINNINVQRTTGTMPTTETSPPYPVPLRGIKVLIRCYEPDSRLFHQMSVIESFVPE